MANETPKYIQLHNAAGDNLIPILQKSMGDSSTPIYVDAAGKLAISTNTYVHSVKVKGGTGITVSSEDAITNTGERTISLSSVTTAGTRGLTANQTPSYGQTFNVPGITYDVYGRITLGTNYTVKIPALPSPGDIGAASSGHDHPLSIAADTGTSALTLSHGSKYKLTAGNNTYIFTMPGTPSYSDVNAAPTSHASSATTYGVGTTSNYGHVKLVTGDLTNKSAADGQAASVSHNHATEISNAITSALTSVMTYKGPAPALSTSATSAKKGDFYKVTADNTNLGVAFGLGTLYAGDTIVCGTAYTSGAIGTAYWDVIPAANAIVVNNNKTLSTDEQTLATIDGVPITAKLPSSLPNAKSLIIKGNNTQAVSYKGGENTDTTLNIAGNGTVSVTASSGTITISGSEHPVPHLYVGTSGTAADDAAGTNGTVHLKLYQGSTAKESHKIQGSGTVKVTASSGTITVEGESHHTAAIYVGENSTAASNAASSNGSTYIKLIENGAKRSANLIKGSGSVTVTSDASGTITINGTDNNNAVTQTVDATNAEYNLLFSQTAKGGPTATLTEGAKKSDRIIFNPYTGKLTLGTSTAQGGELNVYGDIKSLASGTVLSAVFFSEV